MTESGKMADIVKQDIIEKKIFLIRGLNVMLDKDLAELYGVKTKSLNLAVKRNKERFPNDFMFQLTKEEFENLRSQFETSRWIISKNLCYNIPSTDTVMRGQYSEVKRTANFPPFNAWWEKSEEIASLCSQ